jgi:Lipocalin-like domain
MKVHTCLILALIVAGVPAASPGGASAPLRRENLIGAWRLVGMTYSGPDGRTDPFYQPDSTGLIMYDASGWMSVEIGAPHRAKWEVPAGRLAPPNEREAPLKAAAFDSYYAYYGTWDFDERSSVVTHHVTSALLPSEDGLDYSQAVVLDHGHLVFTTHVGSPGREIVRTKTWERAAR